MPIQRVEIKYFIDLNTKIQSTRAQIRLNGYEMYDIHSPSNDSKVIGYSWVKMGDLKVIGNL